MISFSKRDISVSILASIILIVTALFIASCTNSENIIASPDVEIDDNSGELSIQASGSAYVNPDLAIISLGVRTFNKNIDAAQLKNEKTVNRIITVIKNLGVEQKNIQTSSYNVSTQYEKDEDVYPGRIFNEDGVVKIEYFEVSNTLTIRAENLDIVEAILNEAIVAGATAINSIEFTLKDYADARKKAYEQAVDMTKKRAKYLASSFDVELGKPITIDANHSDYRPYFNYGSMTNQSVSFGSGSGGGGGDSISGGQIQVKVNISAKYRVN